MVRKIKENKTHRIMVRLSPEQRDLLADEAYSLRINLSTYLRGIILGEYKR